MTEPRSVSAFVESALYDPGRGFYETGGRAGRRLGSFLTSPEVGPLFGAVLARALDGWWDDLDRPDPFVVEDHGAGPATLARTLLAAAPRCSTALRVVAVERSAAQRALHPAHLPHVGDWAERGATWDAPGRGPLVASAADVPDGPGHVVVANELLDNLPFDLFERTETTWQEVRLAEGTDGTGREHLVAADPEMVAWADRLAPHAPVGGRVPGEHQAARWLADVLERIHPGGRVLVLDYASTTTSELADRPWRDWVRTYRDHQAGGSPWGAPGSQDVTVEVAVDQLASVRPPSADRTQADALRAWGLDELVAEGRALWRDRDGPADLAALRARSRAGEAEALVDPTGLGAHRVLEWHLG